MNTLLSTLAGIQLLVSEGKYRVYTRNTGIDISLTPNHLRLDDH